MAPRALTPVRPQQGPGVLDHLSVRAHELFQRGGGGPALPPACPALLHGVSGAHDQSPSAASRSCGWWQ